MISIDKSGGASAVEWNEGDGFVSVSIRLRFTERSKAELAFSFVRFWELCAKSKHIFFDLDQFNELASSLFKLVNLRPIRKKILQRAERTAGGAGKVAP